MANANPNLSVGPELFELISRDDAAAAGFKRYFTGVPCRRGHIAQRYVSTTSCVDCLRRNFTAPGGSDNYMDPARIEFLRCAIPIPKGRPLDEIEAFMAALSDYGDDVAKALGWPEGPAQILQRCILKTVVPFRLNRSPGRRYNNG